MPTRNLIQGLLDQTSREVALLGAAERRAVYRVLRQAEVELSADLNAWLAGVDRKDTYTAQKHASLLRQIGPMRERLSELDPEVYKALSQSGVTAGAMATAHAKFEAERLADLFDKNPVPVNLDVAAVLAKNDKSLMRRHARHSKKYSRETQKHISRHLAVGVLRRETIDQMTTRLAKLSKQPVLDSATGDMAANGLFNMSRHSINRLVRTEAIHAYNVHHLESIKEMGMMKRWDSSLDRRGCIVCRELDGKSVPHDKDFPGGFAHPPAHPYCRCALVPWDSSWDHPSLPSEGTELIEPPGTGEP